MFSPRKDQAHDSKIFDHLMAQDPLPMEKVSEQVSDHVA